MKTKPDSIVGYLRTSTKDQLLGIDGQREALERIARDRGCQILRTFTEHESGGDNERVELEKALGHAKRSSAILVVAKLDRLSRDSTFLMKLYDSKVSIVFGDLPEIDGSAASRFMVQTMANVAEFERRRIGERTKAALAVLKARGVKLGTPANLTPEARIKGVRKAAANRTARALEDMADVTPIAAKMAATGSTLQDIADHLNEDGCVTRMGSTWSATQVARLLDRAGVHRTDRRRRATPRDAV
jgi:DNA invertase Pin-like site-specific DNA recombinase